MEQKPTTAEKKAVYDAARAAQFGNVHERMKFLACALMKAKKDHGDLFDKHPALMELREAIFNLQVEISLNDCDPLSRASGTSKALKSSRRGALW